MSVDPARLLAQGLERSMAAPGVTAHVSDIRSRPWASATFEGARHRLALRLEGRDAAHEAARLLAGLEDWDVPMRGQFLAEISFLAEERWDSGAVCLHFEALTIECD